MSISVSNTTLNNSFETWRLNTNEVATILSNNVVTVARDGGANRQAFTVGNGHIVGTFTANELRTTTLMGGNTSSDGNLTISGNTTIGGDNLGTSRSLTVYANTVFNGNVNFNTVGSDRVFLGDISRIIVNGGTKGQFLRLANQNDNPEFKTITMSDIRPDAVLSPDGLVINHANLIFTAQSATTDSTQAVWTNGQDKIIMFMAPDVTVGDSDLYLGLADDEGDSRFVITDNSNTVVGYVTSDGVSNWEGRLTAPGVTVEDSILPDQDDQRDIGSSTFEFKDLYLDGVAYIDELSVATGASQGVSTSLIPKTDAVGNLGSSNRKWSTAWADTTNGGDGVFKTVGVSQTLNVNGQATFAGHSITVSGNTWIDTKLDVEGRTTLADLHANGAVDFDSTLNVDGNATFNGDVTLGDTDADTITVVGKFANQSTTGTATFNGDMYLGNAQTDTITVKGKFANQSTTGTATFNGDMYLGNATTDTIMVKGNFANQHTEGRATFSDWQGGGVGVGALPDTGFDLTVGRDAIVKRDLQVTRNLDVDGNFTLSGSLTLSDPSGTILTAQDFETENMHVSGNTYLGDGTADLIYFNGTANSSLTIVAGTRHNLGTSLSKWHQVYANNVTVGNDVTISNYLTVTGNTSIASNVYFGDNLVANVGGDLHVVVDRLGKIHANNAIRSGAIASSQLANTTVRTQFDAASVTAGSQTYGSATLVPVITVNPQGQITGVVNTAVAGVSTFSYASAFRNFYIDTADGQRFTANIAHQSLYANAMATPLDPDGNALTTHFDVDGASNGYMVYGSATRVPIITVNRAGQVIEVANVDVAGVSAVSFAQANSNLTISTADGSTYDVNIHNGVPSIVAGTTNEIVVNTDTANTYTIGLPSNVSIAENLTVGHNIHVTGNLYVEGTRTEINVTELHIDDNIITLNNDVSGVAPTDDSGIEIKRGLEETQRFIWNETDDRWNAKDAQGAWQIIEADKVYALANNATVLENSRNFSISGDVVATAQSFDGSQNVTLTAAIQADTISSTELANETRLRILNSSGTTLKTLWGAGN